MYEGLKRQVTFFHAEVGFLCRMRTAARRSRSVQLCNLVYAACFPRSAGSNVYVLYSCLLSQFKTWKVRLYLF